MNTTIQDPQQPATKDIPDQNAGTEKNGASIPETGQQKPHSELQEPKALVYARLATAVAVLVLLIYIVLNPAVTYGPVARMLIFLLASAMIAFLVGTEAVSRFELRLPGFVFMTAGAAAICFGGAYGLYHVTKPDIQVSIFNVYDEDDKPVNLIPMGALELPITNAIHPVEFHTGNTLIIVFPEQLTRQEIRIRKSTDGLQYVGTVSYTSSGEYKLRLASGRKIETDKVQK